MPFLENYVPFVKQYGLKTNKNATLGGTLTVTGATAHTGAVTGSSVAVTAGLTSSGATGAGVGYAAGAGGAVTQATNRTTGVTLSKLSGQITTNAASLAAAAKAAFTVTNTTVAATDVVVTSITSGGTGTPRVDVIGVAAGSFILQVTNDHAATADTSADVINFAVVRAVAA